MSKILKHYGVLPSELETLELKLRIWFCNTILRPLVAKVDELNSLFAGKFSGLHIRLGASTTETLRNALSHKPDLYTTALPFVLPYFQVHHNQGYLIRRFRELAENIALEDYKWNSGGLESTRDDKNGYIFAYLYYTLLFIFIILQHCLKTILFWTSILHVFLWIHARYFTSFRYICVILKYLQNLLAFWVGVNNFLRILSYYVVPFAHTWTSTFPLIRELHPQMI